MRMRGWMAGVAILALGVPGAFADKLYSVSTPPTGGGNDVFKSYIVSSSDLGNGRILVREKNVAFGRARTRSTAVDCHSPSVGSQPITVNNDSGYRPPLSDWDRTNLWWAACRGQYRRYGGRLMGAVPGE